MSPQQTAHKRHYMLSDPIAPSGAIVLNPQLRQCALSNTADATLDKAQLFIIDKSINHQSNKHYMKDHTKEKKNPCAISLPLNDVSYQ